MNVLEKILKEIKQPTNYTVMCGKHFTTIDRVEKNYPFAHGRGSCGLDSGQRAVAESTGRNRR